MTTPVFPFMPIICSLSTNAFVIFAPELGVAGIKFALCSQIGL
jgi:hypothetical protein